MVSNVNCILLLENYINSYIFFMQYLFKSFMEHSSKMPFFVGGVVVYVSYLDLNSLSTCSLSYHGVHLHCYKVYSVSRYLLLYFYCPFWYYVTVSSMCLFPTVPWVGLLYFLVTVRRSFSRKRFTKTK